MPPREPKVAQEQPIEPTEIVERELLGDTEAAPVIKAETEPGGLELRQRIAELEAELAKSKSAEQRAKDALAENQAAAQGALIFNAAVTEIHAGKRDDGVDMWKYKIDLSPSGGTEVRLNGIPYYHGEVYEFDTATLRTIKEIVARTWDHERNISGNNENVYRREMNTTISGRGGRR